MAKKKNGIDKVRGIAFSKVKRSAIGDWYAYLTPSEFLLFYEIGIVPIGLEVLFAKAQKLEGKSNQHWYYWYNTSRFKTAFKSARQGRG